MSSAPPNVVAPRRNPRRHRTGTVAYKETTESDDDQLIDEDDIIWTYNNVDFDADQAPKSTVFKFQELPPEIRLMIITLVTQSPDRVISLQPQPLNAFRLRRWLVPSLRKPTGAWAERWDRERFKNFNLILTCKDINICATPYIYEKQTFYFTRLVALQTFLLPMRQETLDLLRYIDVNVGNNEWHMMPAIAALLSKCRFLERLAIHGICELTSQRDVETYLNYTNQSLSTWAVTEESFDKIHGIKLACDLYPFMYPFFNPIIRAQPVPVEPENPAPYFRIRLEDKLSKPIAGVEQLMQVVRFYESRAQPRRWFTIAVTAPFWTWINTSRSVVAAIFRHFVSAPKDDEQRQVTIRKAMGEELVKLVARDTY